MKKEEFLTKLRKNLSVLEEREIQDIVEEYEQHIDMKMKGGLSQEEAIKDFGDLKELTAGILEAYHVKADYQEEKKNIDFDKVKEESRKATEKATSVIGKGAGALGKGAGVLKKEAGMAGKWGVRQIKNLYNLIKRPFIRLRERIYAGKKKAKGKGLFGRLWTLVLGICSLIWHIAVCFVRLCWNLFWLFCGMIAGLATLGCIFCFGVLAVLLVMGYPVIGITIVTIGGGLVNAALLILCITLLKKKSVQKDPRDTTKNPDMKDFHVDNSKQEEDDWEYPDGGQSQQKQITINSYQEVANHA